MSVFHFFHFLYSQLTFSKEKKRKEFGCFSFIEMVLCRSNKSGSLSSHIYLSALYFFYLLLFFFLFCGRGQLQFISNIVGVDNHHVFWFGHQSSKGLRNLWKKSKLISVQRNFHLFFFFQTCAEPNLEKLKRNQVTVFKKGFLKKWQKKIQMFLTSLWRIQPNKTGFLFKCQCIHI